MQAVRSDLCACSMQAVAFYPACKAFIMGYMPCQQSAPHPCDLHIDWSTDDSLAVRGYSIMLIQSRKYTMLLPWHNAALFSPI